MDIEKVPQNSLIRFKSSKQNNYDDDAEPNLFDLLRLDLNGENEGISKE